MATPIPKRIPGKAGDVIKVFVRTRPLLSKEINKNAEKALNVNLSKNQIIDDINEKFYQFDGVFDDTTTQQDVYERTLSPLIKQVLNGQNITVLAYGQTGSGKTFTMGTDPATSEENEGLVQRALKQILDSKFSPMKDLEKLLSNKRRSSGRLLKKANNTEVKLSFSEIYNESVYDLLAAKRTPLETKPDGAGGIEPVGVKEVTVNDVDDGLILLEQGNRSRAVASTIMNNHSSRSHAIITIKLINQNKTKPFSRLQLVDLAGAEGVGKAQMEGQQFNEGVSINSGLLTLGKVLTALSSGNQYIPFRESLVTRLLRSSLCGTNKTLMIACISPANLYLNETLNILRYAEQARNVRARPVIAPSSVMKSGIKRRLADVSATPGSNRKRFNSNKKPPLHNTTISTPGHKPPTSRISSKSKLNSTFNNGIDSILNSTTASMDEEISGDTFAHKIVAKPLFKSPIPPATPAPALEQTLLNPIFMDRMANQLEQSILNKFESFEDRVVDKLVSRLTRTKQRKNVKKDNSRTSTPVKAEGGCSTYFGSNENRSTDSPDIQGFQETLVTSMMAQFDMKKVFEEYAKNTVNSMLNQTRRSKRLSSTPFENQNTTNSIHNTFIKDTKLKSSNIQPNAIKSPLSDVTNTFSSYNNSCLNNESSMNDTMKYLPITSTARMDNKIVRKSTRLSTRRSVHNKYFGQENLNFDDSNDKTTTSLDVTAITNVDETIINNFDGSPVLKQPKEKIEKNIELSQSKNEDTVILNEIPIPLGELGDYSMKGKRRSSRRSALVAMQRNSEILNFQSPQPVKGKIKNTLKLNATIDNTSRRKSTRLAKNLANSTLQVSSPDNRSFVPSPMTHKKHSITILNLLNKGSLKELQKLPTVGPKTAMVIYNYRNLIGKLKSINDLRNIPGLTSSYITRFTKANFLEGVAS